MNISKHTKIILAGLLAVLVACGFGFVDNMFNSSAATDTFKDLSTLENAEQITDTTKIPADYTFFPDIQYSTNGSQITTTEPFGSWDYESIDTVEDGTEKPLKGIANIVWISKDDTSYNGKIGMKYNNVGTYNGHTISLKVTYMGTTEKSSPNGFALIMYNNSLGLRTSTSPYAVKIKYEFFDAETNEPITVKGYQSFGDIDAYQGLKIDNYDKIYYAEDAAKNNLQVANYGKGYENVIQSTIGNISEDPTNSAVIAYTFTGSEINFTWTSHLAYRFATQDNYSPIIVQCYKDKDKENSITQALNTYYYTDESGNLTNAASGGTRKSAVLTLRASSEKIVPSETKEPLKSVSDIKGDALSSNVVNKTDKFYFSVIHEVPGETTSNYYTSYVLTDKLDKSLTITKDDVVILNDATKMDVTSKFDITVTEENGAYVVKATAKVDTLTDASFYNVAYNMVLGVSVKDGYDLSSYFNDDTYQIKNVANVTVNDNTKDSNDVTVKLTENPTLDIEKTTDKNLYNVGDTVNYTIKVTQSKTNAVAKNVVIEDKIADADVELVDNSIEITDKDGNKVDTAVITTSGNSFKIETKANLRTDEFFTVTYRAKLTNEVLAGKSITNTAITKADETPEKETTKTITVDTLKVPELTISKTVNKTDYSIGDKVSYTLKVTQITKDCVAKNIVINDAFNTTLVKPENIKVTDKDGKTIDNAEIKMNENGFTINTNTNLAVDEYITVVYSVTLRDSALMNTSINNVATAKGDNTDQVKDDAKVNVLSAKLDIKKSVNKTSFSTNDKAKYTLVVKQTVENAVAKNVVIADTLDNELVEPENIKITDKDGNVLENADINKTDNGFVIYTNENLAKDEFFTVTYNVTLSNPTLSGKDIKNTATAKANNVEEVKDTKTITITTPALEITKKADKDVYSTGEMAKYTLVVKQTVKNAVAKNVVVSDSYDNENISKPSNIKIVDSKGKEVSNAEVIISDNGFVINTNSNLAADEYFTITYNVSMANPSLSGKIIKNKAEASGENVEKVVTEKEVSVTTPALDIQKTVNKNAFSSNETAKYTVVVKQTVANALAKNVVITDTFDNENIMAPSNIKLTDSKGQEITNADINQSGNTLTINTNTDLAENEFITLTYDVKLSSPVLCGATVNNVATATADNTEKVESNASITIGTPDLTIEKTSDKEEYGTDENATYTIKVTQTVKDAAAVNVSVVDLFDNDKVNIIADTVKVKDMNGNEIEAAQFEKTADGYVFNTFTDLGYNDFLTITYTANFKNDELAGATIKNTATAKSETTKDKVVEKTVKILEPVLKVEKTSDQAAYLLGSTAKYTVKITQTQENAIAKNVVIVDELSNQKAKVVKDTIKIVDSKGNELTDTEIVAAENAYQIKTHKNLAYNESFTITYDVSLTDVSLNNTDIVNSVNGRADNSKSTNIDHTVKVSDNKQTVNQINRDAGVQTGNNLPIKLFGLIALISILGITTSVVIKKRK